MNDKLKSVPGISLSLPRFKNEAQAFAKDMAQYSTETIAEMLGCSQQIAVHNMVVPKRNTKLRDRLQT